MLASAGIGKRTPIGLASPRTLGRNVRLRGAIGETSGSWAESHREKLGQNAGGGKHRKFEGGKQGTIFSLTKCGFKEFRAGKKIAGKK